MLTIFSDGGARGNPGPAACAYAIFNGEKLIKKGSKYLGKTTNNVAEYSGVIFALEALVGDRLDTNAVFKMDSELVVKQINGIYKVKNKNLMTLILSIKKIIEDKNLDVNFVHVPRSQNAFADKMVNEKLDETSRL